MDHQSTVCLGGLDDSLPSMTRGVDGAPKWKVGVPLYPTFDSLDVLGPVQVLTLLGARAIMIGPSPEDLTADAAAGSAGAKQHLLDAQNGYVRSFEGLKVVPDFHYADYPSGFCFADLDEALRFDVLFVPGAIEPQQPLRMERDGRNPYLDLLVDAGGQVDWVTSVCTGALLLAAAGLLDGHQATTHWDYKSVLELFQPKVRLANGYPRWTPSGNRLTGGGISSGIDQAFYLASLLADNDDEVRRVQLTMQYAPQPPFNSGNPAIADPETVEQTREKLRAVRDQTYEAFSEFVQERTGAS